MILEGLVEEIWHQNCRRKSYSYVRWQNLDEQDRPSIFSQRWHRPNFASESTVGFWLEKSYYFNQISRTSTVNRRRTEEIRNFHRLNYPNSLKTKIVLSVSIGFYNILNFASRCTSSLLRMKEINKERIVKMCDTEYFENLISMGIVIWKLQEIV